MTEEIDNLQAGRELDALIAERVFDDLVVLRGGVPYSQRPLPHNDMHFVPVEPYSTDIGSAWLVVEKLREMGFLFGLCDQAQTKLHAAGFSTWTSVPISAYASTDALAICRAALKAVSALKVIARHSELVTKTTGYKQRLTQSALAERLYADQDPDWQERLRAASPPKSSKIINWQAGDEK